MNSFQECWDRVDRADLHAKTLVGACEALLSDKSYEVRPELRDERYGILVIHPNVPIDRNLSFELGEYFYQLRATLDSAMWIAYETWGLSDPTTDLKKLYFPVISGGGTLNKQAFNGVNLPKELNAWIRSIQPCLAPQRAKDSDASMLSETIATINQCAAHDRHRKLQIVGAFITQSSAIVEVTPPATIAYQRSVTTGDYFKGKFEVVEFTIDGWTSETQVRGQGQFVVEVSVKEIPKSLGDFLGVQLRTISNNVRVILQEFERYIN